MSHITTEAVVIADRHPEAWRSITVHLDIQKDSGEVAFWSDALPMDDLKAIARIGAHGPVMLDPALLEKCHADLPGKARRSEMSPKDLELAALCAEHPETVQRYLRAGRHLLDSLNKQALRKALSGDRLHCVDAELPLDLLVPLAAARWSMTKIKQDERALAVRRQILTNQMRNTA